MGGACNSASHLCAHTDTRAHTIILQTLGNVNCFNLQVLERTTVKDELVSIETCSQSHDTV